MWIARDKNRRLKLWQVKPHRGTYHWHAIDKNKDSYYSMIIDNDTTIFHTYKFMGWEDEPIEVNLVPKSIDEEKLDELAENCNINYVLYPLLEDYEEYN